MKKMRVLFSAVMLMAVAMSITALAQEKAVPAGFASQPALYAHAVSGADDAQAWQMWQSIHDEEFEEKEPSEKYFFLPSSAGKHSVDLYNAYDEDVVFNEITIASHTTEAVPYEAERAYSVSVGGQDYTLALMNSDAEAAIYMNNTDADGKGFDLMSYLSQDKSHKASATGAIVTPDGRIDHTGIKKIKGRGNTSWEKPKKSYNITYEDKAGIAGLDEHKTYSIVANYQDDSLSRNRILYDLSDAVGLPYAPDSRYVDLYANGYYWGSYLLCEKIEPGSLLPEVEEKDYLNEDASLREDFEFVVEINNNVGDDDYWFESKGLKIAIISPQIDPDEPGYNEVREYVKERFNHFYEATAPSGDLSSAADIDSLTRLYLINELGKNWDSGAGSTFFCYMQDENGVYKFYGSPVWDYDNTLGNATGVAEDLLVSGVTDYEEYTGWWCQYKGKTGVDEPSANIMGRISLNHEVQAVAGKIWFEDFVPAIRHFAGDQYDPQVEGKLKTREEYYALLQKSAQMNYTSGWLLRTGTWIKDHTTLNNAVYDEDSRKMIVDETASNYDQGDFTDMYNYACDWMLSRAAWLSEQFAGNSMLTDVPESGEDTGDQTDEMQLIEDMILYYGCYGEEAEEEIDECLWTLKETDISQGELWEDIMDYWEYVDTELVINTENLPDNLPEDNSFALVILGGGLADDGSMKDELIERLKLGLACAEQYPDAYVVCTGGGTAKDNKEVTEAGQMGAWLMENGLEEHRLVLEDQSRSTIENAQFTLDMLCEEYPQVDSLAIVSSDYHITRACLLFETAALRMTDYGQEPEVQVVSNCGSPAPDRDYTDEYLRGWQMYNMLQLIGEQDLAKLYVEDPDNFPRPELDEAVLLEPDYSEPENWAYFGIGDDKEADLFLVCPTVDTKDEYTMPLDDEELKENFLGALNMERGIYEDSARLFAPYYRQAAMKVFSLDSGEWEPYLELAYDDVSAAFSWYLEHENEGRPIILAGFSQGANMCYRLLEEYFGDEELYEQLIAVYAIGWPCTEEMVSEFPQIHPAESARDTGTVITFDCEAPEVTETFINPAGQKTFSINPLNWETDGTPADKSLNIGACFTKYSGEISHEEAGLCGCYIDESRGVLKVTDIDQSDYPALVPGLPEGGYHIYDYQFFFRNLQENVRTRVDCFMEEKAEEILEPAA